MFEDFKILKIQICLQKFELSFPIMMSVRTVRLICGPWIREPALPNTTVLKILSKPKTGLGFRIELISWLLPVVVCIIQTHKVPAYIDIVNAMRLPVPC